MRLRISFIFSIFFGTIFYSFGQLNVYSNGSAGALAQNIVGNNIQISNAQLNCGANGSGTFTASGTNLGLTSGILLTTGSVGNAVGPNNDAGSGAGSTCHNSGPNFSDPDLSAIEPAANYDGCVLQFDIIPICNTMNIKYVFGSEEYPEFEFAGYNDAFGFFITGPNPAGGTYNGFNMARLGNGTPVSIDNINNGASNSGPCNNCGAYVNNSGGSTIQYDGFTTPLTASVSVTPCMTYHLKLAIADAGDCIYDSGVFLAFKGLTCPNTQIPNVTLATTPVHCGNDGSITATVTNYTGTPTYSWAPGGATTSTINNLGPGTYTCTVGFAIPCPYTQTVSATVSGTNVINSTTSTSASNCNAPDGVASVTVSGGTGPYTYSWNTTPTQTTPTATGLIPGTYVVTITDNSGCVVIRTVTVANFQPTLNVTDSIVNTTCSQSNGAVFINSINGGTLPYSYSWNTGQSTQDITNIPSGNETVTITDNIGCTWTYNYTVPNIVNIPIDTSHINEKCLQGNGSATVTVLHGVAPYTYAWNTTPAQTTATASGLSAGTYSVLVTDAAGCTASASFNVINVNDVFNGSVGINPPEPMAGNNFTVTLNLPSNWTLDQSNWPDTTISFLPVNSALNFPLYGSYNGSFWVTSSNNCHDTIPYTVFVKDFMTLYVPNAFTPNDDAKNDSFYAYGTLVKTFRMEVFDRWGNLIFESDDLEKGWDGFYKGKKVMNDVYVWKIAATDYFDTPHNLIGHVTVVR